MKSFSIVFLLSIGYVAISSVVQLKESLRVLTNKAKPNGINASKSLRMEITKVVEEIERKNPTRLPALSPLVKGLWRMCYTDFEPAAASSGKLGPFIGDVFQDLTVVSISQNKVGEIKNILKIKFPVIEGALVAKQSIRNANTWQIEFEEVRNSIFGFQLPVKTFPQETSKKEIRLWEVIVVSVFPF
jgi:PAP_fibrillin